MNKLIQGVPVSEGVLIRAEKRAAMAVRLENGAINCIEVQPPSPPSALLKFPFVRGVYHLFEALFSLPGALLRKKAGAVKEMVNPIWKIHSPNALAWITAGWCVLLILLCMLVLPQLLYGLLLHWEMLQTPAAIIQCVFRAFLFLPMIKWISRARFLRRLAMYHGACHKAINCYKSNKPLTVENVLLSPRISNSSSGAFATAVAFATLLMFAFIPTDGLILPLMLLARLIILLITAAVMGEISALYKLPMLFEELTTMEPNLEMIEVAICAMNKAIGENSADEASA